MRKQLSEHHRVNHAKGGRMDVLWVLGVIVVWFLLQRWILPWFGVPT